MDFALSQLEDRDILLLVLSGEWNEESLLEAEARLVETLKNCFTAVPLIVDLRATGKPHKPLAWMDCWVPQSIVFDRHAICPLIILTASTTTHLIVGLIHRVFGYSEQDLFCVSSLDEALRALA